MEVQYALTVLGGMDLAKMDEVDRMFLEESVDSALAYEFKPVRLKSASGGAKSFQDAEGNMIPAPLEGYVIDALRTRAFWPRKMDDGGNPIPFCSSLGGVFGTVNPSYTMDDVQYAAAAQTPHPAIIDLERSDDVGGRQYDCVSCPMAQFGSHFQGGEGRGQACSAKVQFLFLPQGWSQPCLLSVPTTSMKNWFTYASGLKQKTGREYFTFKTRISIELVKNKDNVSYGIYRFENLGGITDKMTAEAVLTCRRELKKYLHTREVAIVVDEGDVVEVNGRVVDAETGEIVK